MQYAFAYFHFLALERSQRTAADVLRDADEDGDGALSSNELLTVVLQNKRRGPSRQWPTLSSFPVIYPSIHSL